MKLKTLPIECPFCHSIPELVKTPLWYGTHGYRGCYEYSVRCTNEECLVKPHTHEYNDIYDMDEDECFSKAINDWNTR